MDQRRPGFPAQVAATLQKPGPRSENVGRPLGSVGISHSWFENFAFG